MGRKRCPAGFRRVEGKCETPEMTRIRHAAQEGEIEWNKMPIDFAYEEAKYEAKGMKKSSNQSRGGNT